MSIANRIAKASRRAARPSLFDRPTSTRIAQTVRRGFSRVPPTTSSSSLSLSLSRAQRTITLPAPGPRPIRIAAPTDRENLPENRRRHSLISIIIVYYSPVAQEEGRHFRTPYYSSSFRVRNYSKFRSRRRTAPFPAETTTAG